jgi:Rrf2 family protein
MRTSCRFAMAVHVLTVLAYKEGDRITSSYLADSVNTNPVIIRRLLSTLQKAKLVDTSKGAGSGSRLERSPSRITLAEVYKAVEEEDPFTMPRQKPNEECPVGQCIQDELERVFTSAEQAMTDQLARTTIADVINSVRRKCAAANKGK